MTKSPAWVCLLLLLATASAAAIPSGSFAHTSITSSASPSSTERPQTLVTPLKQRTNRREDQSSSTEDKTPLKALHGRQQDGPAQNQMWADQLPTQVTLPTLLLPQVLTSSTRPYAEEPLVVATLTVVRTVTVDFAGQTKLVFSPLRQTLTFINPVVVFETRTVPALQQSQNIVARGKTNTAPFDQDSHPVALPAFSPQPKETTLVSRPVRLRRQTLGPATRVSTTTVEITTTLTNFGSIRTITVLNPVFVSVTVDQTVTTTRFTTTLSPETTATLPPAGPTRSSGEENGLTDTTRLSSASASVSGSASISTLPVPSETSADAGLTTWFSMPSDSGAQRPTESTAASSTESVSDPTATAAPSESTAAPTPEPASEPNLPPGTVASISLGAVTGLIFLLFVGYVFRSYRQYAKDRQDDQPDGKGYQMTSATAATAIMSRPASASPNPNSQDRAAPGEANSGESSDEGKQVRIVIRPAAVKQQSEGNANSASSEAETLPTNWQRTSGYTNQSYSVSVTGGSDSTPRDTAGWSNRSEYGSTTRRAASQEGDVPELPALGPAAKMKERQ